MTGDSPPASRRRAGPNLYSIPAGEPFLEVLADALLHDRLDLGISLRNPADLARLTVYLPTRRAARAFASVLLKASGLKALILPRLVPLGDPGEADMHDLLDVSAEAADQPLPIDPLTRQLLLALQVRQASLVRDRAVLAETNAGAAPTGSLSASTLGSAFALAGDLAAVLDAMQAENVPYERLLHLDAARFDELWQLTARFLAILGESWPAILAERNVSDPVAWRNQLLARQAARLASGADDRPVVVAGSTGSMPATARLIATVAQLRRGAVVLPDLDLDADDAAWAGISSASETSPDRGASHPQAQLAQLMAVMQAGRRDVVTLQQSAPEHGRKLRRTLAHEALRAAETTAAWHGFTQRMGLQDAENAFAAVSLIEAPDERGEALSIALLIRERLAEPHLQIAVVTPDRGLAERVAIELQRWGITVDDSAGRPLGRTSAGQAFGAMLDLLRSGGRASDLMELAQHPALHLGLEPERRATARQALEIGALRGRAAIAGFAALKAALAEMPDRMADIRAPRPRQRLTSADVAAAHDLVDRLEQALSPLLAEDTGENLDLARCTGLIQTALMALGTDANGEISLFSGADGEALTQLLGDLRTGLAGARGSTDDLYRICRTVMAERVVRLQGHQHPRLALLGPLEARLIAADLIILGGLNEGIWPPQTRTDPFLNRAMRAELRLSSPERRIGQSAHDFIQAFTAPEVVLTRSLKTAGVQSLPSRFWQRLKVVTPADIWDDALQRGSIHAARAARIDQPDAMAACKRPKPKAPLHLHPVRFSVTEAESLYRDPYAIFARRILDLSPLQPLDIALGAADRGQLMHAVLERFAHAWPGPLPPDPLADLLRLGREVFQDLMHEPDVVAFWWPRFVSLAPEIAAWEAKRREHAAAIGAEMRIRHPVRLGDGTEIVLTARADRIELLNDGRLVILDFKTGSVPTPKQIKAGLAPQLLLEAAMAPLSPFSPADATTTRPSLGPSEVAHALYLALKPGADAMAEKAVAKEAELATKAAEHLAGFASMVEGFRSGERSFTSRFAAQFVRFDGDYDHLARVKEWSQAGHDSDEEEA